MVDSSKLFGGSGDMDNTMKIIIIITSVLVFAMAFLIAIGGYLKSKKDKERSNNILAKRVNDAYKLQPQY